MHLLLSLQTSSTDVRILWASVFFRIASFGITNQVLTLFLKDIGISEPLIGVFMTLTLIGDTFLSYWLTWHADHLGRRFVMQIGSLMMLISGVIFATSLNFYILLGAAVIGVVSPLGDETGPFKSIEEAALAHLTPMDHRPEVFAFYGLFATAGAAIGALGCGLIVEWLHSERNWTLLECYRFAFVVYSIVASVKFVLMLFLSRNCEMSNVETGDNSLSVNDLDERSNLLSPETQNEVQETLKIGSNSLSPETKSVLWRLLVIFMLDSLGYGFMPSAWVVYYFKTIFLMSASSLGLLFFFTNSIDAFLSLPSAHFAKVLGPVKAMLLTQVPLAVFFLLIAFVSSSGQYLALALLILHHATSTMDVVPRQILLTLVVPAHELTKVMGVVNVCKTFARCIGPFFTGKLAEGGNLRLAYIINGCCILLADFILGINFLPVNSEIKRKTLGHS